MRIPPIDPLKRTGGEKMTPEEAKKKLEELREGLAKWLFEHRQLTYEGAPPWDGINDVDREDWREQTDTIIRDVLIPSGLGWQGGLLTPKETRAINDAQPAEAKYGDVFAAIAKAQGNQFISLAKEVEVKP